MDLKKSIFSYIVWAAFAPLCCLTVIFALERAGVREMLGLPLAGMVGAVCVYLLFTAAVFLALRTICAEIRRHIQNPRKVEAVLSVVLPVTVLAGVVAYLVLYLTYHMPLTLEEDSFYTQALVSDGKSVSFAVHGASWLYTHLLHVMLLIFGNTPFAGVMLQIVLFFICLLLLYIGMRAFAGTIPAAFSMAAFGFLQVSLQHVFSLTPELFYLVLYLSGFSLAGASCRKFRQRGLFLSKQDKELRSGVQNVLSAAAVFLLGLYIGFLVYLDIYSISLYLFLAVCFSVEKDKVKQAAISYFIAVSGGICGFFLSVTAVSATEKTTVFLYLQELVSLYVSDAGFKAELSSLMPFLPDSALGGSIVLVSFAFGMIPAFFLWKRSQGSAFIVNLFLVCGLSGASVFRLDAQMITAFAWSVLAGLGVYGVVRAAEGSVEAETAEGKEEAADAEKNDGAKKKSAAKAGNKVQNKKQKQQNKGNKKNKEDKKNKEIPTESENNGKLKEEESKKQDKKAQKEENLSETAEDNHKQVKEKMPETADGQGEKKEQEKPAPGMPLHNPLPVPKKKSRPRADFGYQVSDARMEFDLDVADEDDFDW